jgi:hypothetical protein
MDSWERTLGICMAKRRLIAFGSTKIGKPFEATKRRPRIVSSCRSTGARRAHNTASEAGPLFQPPQPNHLVDLETTCRC